MTTSHATPAKPVMLLLLKNPFTDRDYQRMGIERLLRHFDVRILDLTAWLMPQAYAARRSMRVMPANVQEVASYRELRRALRGLRGGFAIDYVGQFSIRALALFDAIKRHGLKLIVIDSGAVPSAGIVIREKTLCEKLCYAVRSRALQRHASARLIQLLLRLLPDQRPDVAFVSGSSWSNHSRYAVARRAVPAHSFDYERALEVEDGPPIIDGPYAVYLDENIAGHEDNAELGLSDPATEGEFYPAFLSFLADFERASGMPVVIAGYPSTDAGRASYFGGRAFFVGKTAELIRHASLVFAHGSTAISYAVIWRKPLVFLTSDEIDASWYGAAIRARAALVRGAHLSIDRQIVTVPDDWWSADNDAYGVYEATYLRAADGLRLSLWDIIAAELLGSEPSAYASRPGINSKAA